MKISEIQSHNISHRICVPFPVHWSDDDVIVTATEKGIQILRTSLRRSDNMVKKWCNSIGELKMTRLMYCFVIIAALVQPAVCSNITYNVFGSATDGLPAAFGDFDADKYTDLFVITKDSKTVKVLLGSDTEPLLRESDALKCTFDGGKKITSVVPGDFDGDAFMDVLVTVNNPALGEKMRLINEVYVLWGHHDKLDCNVKDSLFLLHGQPLAVDCNQDMVIDLFGVNGDPSSHEEMQRGFWIFNKNHSSPFTYKKMKLPDDFDHSNIELKMPHSNAFLDLNYDNYGDLYLTTKNGSAEVWLYNISSRDFEFDHFIHPPAGVDILNKNKHHYIGQTVFQDMALEGKINQVIPVCFDADCTNSSIYLRSETGDKPRWYSIKVHFKDWHLINPDGRRGKVSLPYLETLTLRAGDFNMDGYPDLLATLFYNGHYRTSLLENVECDSVTDCDGFKRTFVLRENALSPYNNNTILGVFYDFLQDGILDVIFVHNNPIRVSAFRNSLDYDANFVKVMVLTGLTHDRKPAVFNPLMKNRSAYVTNLPGPTIIYNTTTQEGDPRSAVSTQLPQSAHFSLNLPYTIFGLGRTPNFVDELSVGVYGQKGKWTQLIPNSQMVVIPWPANDASRWRVQLFVTPSKLIFQSFCALLGTCALISLIIGGLYWKERKEDHKEKLQEAQRFHFDAM